jgi:archaellum component FlaC
MEKVLEQILEKLNSMETEQKEQGKKLSGLDSKVSNLDGKVSNLDSKVSNIEQDMSLMKTQHSEDREILQAVRHAQEAQKAQLDNLGTDLAKLYGEQQKSFETLINMYGKHEFEITQLKKVK